MMLLTNASDESIIVSLEDDSEIEITVMEMKGSHARVIISADQAVEIVCGELSSGMEL